MVTFENWDKYDDSMEWTPAISNKNNLRDMINIDHAQKEVTKLKVI